MSACTLRLLSLLAPVGVVGCDGGSTRPTLSGPQALLTGTWSGTLTIEHTFQTTGRSPHAWLPIASTVSSALRPSNAPPARIRTPGTSTSPRGCTGSFVSVRTADTSRLHADCSDVECASLERSTRRGRVELTKTGS